MSSDYWREKTVLVTGGSSGLGRSLAEAFARRGANVAIAARSQARLDEAAVALRDLGGQTLALSADVTRDEDVARMIAATVERFGRLDALVNCAGRSMRGAAWETTPETFQSLWELNFLAAVRVTRAALPHLLEAKGHLVHIGSLASKAGSLNIGAYPASKFPLDAYSQQLRLELGPRGLHVLLVCPGPIEGDVHAARYAEEAAQLSPEAQRPGGGVRLKLLKPHDVAERIVRACERRKAELVLPGKAKLLFAVRHLSPRLGDWIVRRSMR